MRLTTPAGLASALAAGRRQEDRYRRAAARILAAVREEGDPALRRFARQFDRTAVARLEVGREEFTRAKASLTGDDLRAVREAAGRIRRYHERQLPQGFSLREKDCRVACRFAPIRRVGIYIPGGQSPLVSTVLMTVIPAQVAGVKEIAVCSPPSRGGSVHPKILAVLSRLGIREVYRVGGAQAIAALAYGTRTIAPVDLVAGPGNAYVNAAKQLVFGTVGIDLPAGPSEVAVFADETAPVEFIVADLQAQMEHTGGTGILITTSRQLGRAVAARVTAGCWLAVASRRDALAAINLIAPEHLELMCRNPGPLVREAVAGAVFVGPYSPASLGDYLAGPSHVLPTGGAARFASGLSVYTFLRSTAVIRSGRSFFRKNGPHIKTLAELEDLPAHARTVEVRLEEV